MNSLMAHGGQWRKWKREALENIGRQRENVGGKALWLFAQNLNCVDNYACKCYDDINVGIKAGIKSMVIDAVIGMAVITSIQNNGITEEEKVWKERVWKDSIY